MEAIPQVLIQVLIRLLLLWLSFLGVQCNAFAENITKELYVYTGEDSLAPYDFAIETPVLGTFNPAVFGFLIKANDKQELEPGLIKSWSYDFKQKKYTLVLGDGKFHNGRSITSQDLEFSLLRGFISNAENYHKIQLSDIEGVSSLHPGIVFHTGLVDGIKTIDNKTLEIRLSKPNPIFLLNFTMPFFPLVPIEELKNDYYSWKIFPVGAGPYRMEAPYMDHRVKLTAVSPKGAGAEVIYMDNIRKKNKYDLIFDQVSATEEEKKFQKVLSQYPVSIYSLYLYKTNLNDTNITFR